MINTNNQAILLLTSYFSKSAKGDVKPLSPTEWGRFAHWLNEQGHTPADLVSGDPRTVLRSWSDPKIPLERIEQLLGRGPALALALEKWSRAGIWALTRSDADYPRLLKQRLRTDAPPVLFGCGDVRLLNQTGVSVVGSRKASEIDLDYARALGRRIAEAGFSVVSGGARGIDEEAMLGGLRDEGTVVGVMADSLLQAATASKWRQGLMGNNLVLVSPFYPEAGFNAGNAMARNKYIYCLSQAAVVVHSGSSGGTWNGALENLKKSWVPLWVKRTDDAEAGNQLLVSHGGQWLDERADQLDILTLLAQSNVAAPPVDLLTATSTPSLEDRNTLNVIDDTPDCAPSQMLDLEGHLSECSTEQPEQDAAQEVDFPSLSFYQFFLNKLERHGKPVTIDELVEQWALPKSLLKEWLKQATDEGRVSKLSKPVRYQVVSVSQLGLHLG